MGIRPETGLEAIHNHETLLSEKSNYFSSDYFLFSCMQSQNQDLEEKKKIIFFSERERKVKVAQSCLTLCDPMDYTVHSRLEYQRQPLPSPGDLPHPVIEPRSPALQANYLPAELPGRPKNTGVGDLFLLQGIFSTQESNQGLLHCRRILYQMSYQGNPQLKRKPEFFVRCEEKLNAYGKTSPSNKSVRIS